MKMSKTIAFKDLFEIPLRNGLTKPKKVRGYGYKMVNMGELFAYPIIKNLKMDRVPLKENEKIAFLKNGDLLFARQSLVRSGAGQCSIFIEDNENVCFESHLIRCRLNLKIADPLFYFYFFKSNFGRSIMDTIVEQGAGASGIRGSDLSELQVPYLDLNKQLEISQHLYTLDKKIQLNTQTNQTLEAIAQAIFKSWFVDFDPVRAKAQAILDGKTSDEANLSAMAVISGKAIEDLSQTEYQELWEIADAFPSELVENEEFDEVPKGWEVKPFGDLLSNTIGGDWGKDELDEKHTEQVFVFRGTDLPDVYKGDDRSVPIRFIQNSKLKNRKLQNGDIVIEVSGGSKNQPTGRSLFITDLLLSRFEQPIVPASFCRLFRPKTEKIGLILGLHLQKIYQEGKTWQYQNQSTGISNFQTTVFLENEMVVLPCEIILDFFAKRINPIFGKIYSNENQILAKTRDLLLPKLLNGEI